MREAIILAGGRGTRLQAVVSDVPKPLAPIGGRPFLEYQLRFLVRQGFSHVVLSVGYKREHIVLRFGSHFDTLRITYCAEDEPLGTGGAIKASLNRCESDSVFVFNGDTFADVDCDAIAAIYRRTNKPVLVGASVPEGSRYGSLELRGDFVVGLKDDAVVGAAIINAGCYLLPRRLFDASSTISSFSFENDFLRTALPRRPFSLYQTYGIFIDIGVPQDYLRAQDILPRIFKPFVE